MSGLDPWRLHTGLHNKILQKRHLPDVSCSDVAAGKSESEKVGRIRFGCFLGGGNSNIFLCSSLFGEDSHFD